jgi:hypothetical protein
MLLVRTIKYCFLPAFLAARRMAWHDWQLAYALSNLRGLLHGGLDGLDQALFHLRMKTATSS